MGDATNKQLRVLAIVSICLSLASLAVLLYAKKTVQMKADSTGTIFTGDIKTHIRPKKPVVEEVKEEPKS